MKDVKILKRLITSVTMAVMLCMSLAVLNGCGGEAVVVIDERFFVVQTQDILFNPSRFMGRTIRYEGFFGSMQWDDEPPLHYVARRTLGCCGDDGIIGFEVVLGDIAPPADDAWVEVTGVLHGEGRRLFLYVTHLTELQERGMEFVQ